MKKKNRHKMNAETMKILMVSLLIMALSGCHVKRQTFSEHREKMQTELLRKDSLEKIDVSKYGHNRKMNIRHVEFTTPDTINRQYMKSVTYMTSVENAMKEDSSSLSAEKNERILTEEERTDHQTNKVHSGGSNSWFWIILIFVICGLIIWSLRKWRSHF